MVQQDDERTAVLGQSAAVPSDRTVVLGTATGAGGTATLVALEGGSEDLVLEQKGDRPMSVGRAPSNTFVLDSPYVSASHAVIHVGAQGTVTIRDTGSSNGTLVDGSPIAAATVLVPGSRVSFGRMGPSFELR